MRERSASRTLVKSGRLKGLPITGQKCTAALPDLPTYAESGLPEYAPKTWEGVIAPISTPKRITDKLSSEMAKDLAMPVIVERLTNVGMEPYPTGPAGMAAQMKEDYAEIVNIINTANIKIQQ